MAGRNNIMMLNIPTYTHMITTVVCTLYTTSPRGGKEIEKKGRKAVAGGEA